MARDGRQEHAISQSLHIAIAKCIRNAEIPDEARSRLIRDLCVLFEVNNPVGFVKDRFVAVRAGMDYRNDIFKKLKFFDTVKYLDEVWQWIKAQKK